MDKNFWLLVAKLTDKIKATYESGVTTEEAERLAGEFLHAQLVVAQQLQMSDIDSRMRKSGVKAVRGAVYLEAATKDPKKPSDTLLENLVNTNDLVIGEQQRYDESEAQRASLENYYSIFREAHIHFRSIAKGSFSA